MDQHREHLGRHPRVIAAMTGPIHAQFDAPPEDVSYDRAAASRRVMVEHRTCGMRNSRSLSDRDRHHRRRHESRAVTIAGLVSRRLGRTGIA